MMFDSNLNDRCLLAIIDASIHELPLSSRRPDLMKLLELGSSGCN
jgi:hypothetical protein